jgi:hypothetical protein
MITREGILLISVIGLEYWNIGMLECLESSFTQYSIVQSFQASIYQATGSRSTNRHFGKLICLFRICVSFYFHSHSIVLGGLDDIS